MNTTTKMTLGILGGIGAGLCLGLLMAPDKGSNNRKKIAGTAGDWALKLKHMFSSDGETHHKIAAENGNGKVQTRIRPTQARRKS